MKTSFLLLLIPLLIGLPLIATAAQCAAFRLAQVPLIEVTLSRGSPKATFLLFGTPVAVGYVPIGTRVEFDYPTFCLRPLPIRLALVLCGPAAMLLFATACLGPALALHHLRTGFFQLTLAALHPLTAAPGLIARLQTVFASSPQAMCGIAAAKLAAFNLLPLGGTATLECIRQLLGPLSEHPAMTGFVSASALAAFALGVLWWVALVYYAVTSNA